MILAAGRGERMRPLTDEIPKPLLEAGGKPLIIHLIEGLAAGGFSRLVINHAHLGHRIEEALGDGSPWGVEIHYSPEGQVLETGGGLLRALPLLGPGPFLAVNGDIWTDIEFRSLELPPGRLAHLVLVHNPPHHPVGDFGLRGTDVIAEGEPRYTFAGIGVYHPALFRDCTPGRFPLAPLLRTAIADGRVSGERFDGHWFDIGTPARLQALDQMLKVS
jgi:MurNAc alpha-1-phosphate uridylyltransferase